MENNTLLYDLIDGELIADREDELFYNLSNSSELKSQFKQIMAVKTAIASNTSIYTPPAESTSAIFTGLGLALPGVANEAVKSGFFTVLRSHLFTAAISVVITILLFIWFYGSGGVEFSSSNEFSGTIPPSSSGNGLLAAKNSIPYTTSYEDTQQNVQPQVRTIIKYVYIEKEAEQKQKSYPQIDFSEQFNQYSNSFISEKTQNIYPSNLLHAEQYNPLDIGENFDTKFILEFRNMQEFYHPEPNITPTKFPKFHNMAFNLMYKIDNNFSAGIDLRQENFFQRYNGIDEFGIPSNYSQTPNFTTIDANLRYSYTDFGSIYPFGQLSLGGNKAGTVYRGMVGMEFSPYQNVGFILGYEYSNFIFNHQGNNFNSEKTGFNYGVSIKY